MISFSIGTGCYDDKVWFVAPCSYEEALKWLKDKKINDWDDEGIEEYKTARGITLRRTKKSTSIIMLKEWDQLHADKLSILVHECVHAADFILRDSGVNDTSSESLCYLTHYIFRAILKRANKINEPTERRKN
jgi:hypothetical protein